MATSAKDLPAVNVRKMNGGHILVANDNTNETLLERQHRRYTRYVKRFSGKISADHFHQAQGLHISSIGLGTYLGNPDDESDRAYESSIFKALGSGSNLSIQPSIIALCEANTRSVQR